MPYALRSNYYDRSDLLKHMPYHTTSQQAMETLAAGVGHGRVPNHIQRPPTGGNLPNLKRVKRKKSQSRFTFYRCGGDVSLYDEGLNTSFIASTSPSDKVLKRFRAGVTDVQRMPSIEYLPNNSKVAAKFQSQGKFRDECCLGQAPDAADLLLHDNSGKMPICCSPQVVLPAMSLGPDASNETSSKSEQFSTDTTLIITDQSIILTASIPTLLSSPTQREEVGKRSQKRRGGYINAAFGNINVTESPGSCVSLPALYHNTTLSSLEAEETSQGSQFDREHSLSSTTSFASLYSAVPDHMVVLSRSTLGGAVMIPAISQYNLEEFETGRASVATTQRTFSVGSGASLTESLHSPAIGEVLSHFPSLSGMNDMSDVINSTNDLPNHSSGTIGSKGQMRIHTFGACQRQCDMFPDPDHSPVRVNSFQYDEELASQWQLQYPHRPSLEMSQPSSISSPSSSLSVSTSSSRRTDRSLKRAAVVCLSSSGSLLTLRSGREGKEDLAKEDADLRNLSPGDIKTNPVNEGYASIERRMSVTPSRGKSSEWRPHSSQTNVGPLSPPPNLPLPPLPPSKRRGERKSSHNPSTGRQEYHTLRSLPHSQTCPDLTG